MALKLNAYMVYIDAGHNYYCCEVFSDYEDCFVQKLRLEEKTPAAVCVNERNLRWGYRFGVYTGHTGPGQLVILKQEYPEIDHVECIFADQSDALPCLYKVKKGSVVELKTLEDVEMYSMLYPRFAKYKGMWEEV